MVKFLENGKVLIDGVEHKIRSVHAHHESTQSMDDITINYVLEGQVHAVDCIMKFE